MALPKEEPTVENQSESLVSKPDELAESAAVHLEPLLNLLVELNIVAGSEKNLAGSEPALGHENDRSGVFGIGAGSDKHSGGSEPVRSDENAPTQLLGNLNEVSPRSEEVAPTVGPETLAPEPDSSERRNEVRGLPFQGEELKNFSPFQAGSFEDPDNPKSQIPNPKSNDDLAFIDELKSWLFVTEKLTTSELEKNYSSAQTIDVLAIASPDLAEKSPPTQELSNSTITDGAQEIHAPLSDEASRNLQNFRPLETDATTGKNPPKPAIITASEPPKTGYLDAAAAPAREMPSLLEQQTPISPATEILGEIREDFNQADSGIEALQNLIFGSKISDIEQVKNLLAENDLPGVRRLMQTIDCKLEKLEEQIYDPQQLIALMLPWIAEILSRKVTDSKEEVVRAIVPIIDEVIRAKTVENKSAMSSAIADLLPDALSQQIHNSPAEIAHAIAPEIGMAIKEQIRLDKEAIAQALAPEMGRAITAQIELERDAMVDALYPVIGNTISRYMAEAIKTINEKVSNTLSVEGVQRKIRSKVQGVSEAELILRESIPFTVQAAFLIHKASGLVISESQHSGEYKLESEMVAGMLTAIRSFVNECIVQPGQVSELNQIEYGDSKIMLEVAGYCYMAVVIKGEPQQWFIDRIRKTVSNLILNYAKLIHEFNGDPDTIPESLHPFIETLFDPPAQQKITKPPLALVGVCLAGLCLILVPWGISQHRNKIERRLEANAALALASAPELAVYRLNTDVEGETLKLTGKLPNPELRAKAEKIAKSIAPNLKLDNQIIAVNVPPDPVLTAAEVVRITAVLNKIEGVSISTKYADRRVTVEGTVFQDADAYKITQSLKQIPGVESVISTVKLNPLKISSRIYFEQGIARLDSTHQETIVNIKNFLQQHPQKRIKIIGHSDRVGEAAANQQLALLRAQAVRDALVLRGVDPKRLQVVGNPNPPAGVEPNQPLLLSRCVLFEPITQNVNGQ